jgi:putative transposase
MLRKRFTETEIATILKEAEAGTPIPELCRRYGIGHTTYYKWRNQYTGMTPDMLSQLRTLEAENARLKRMYADLSLEHQALKDIVRKKL